MSLILEKGQNTDLFQILILDDAQSIRWVLERTLTQAGYITYLAENALEA